MTAGGEEGTPAPPQADLCHLALALEVAAASVSEAVMMSDECGTHCACRRGAHAEQVFQAIGGLEKAINEMRQAVAEAPVRA